MKTSKEVLLTTDTNNAFCNVCVWDTESGSSRNSYKGGTSAPNALAFIGDHYIVSAQLGKPVVQLWEVHKRDQLCLHSVTPGVVTALAISPDGQICVAGIEDKLFVWLTATGQLKSVLRRHYQPVSAIKFTDDGCLFVSGGWDSLVIVWSSAEALAGSYEASGDEASSPEHIWSDHSLPVTSVVVGKGGSQARVFTSSLDQSCKVFDLVSGQLLLSVIFDVRLQCVAVDPVESAMFAGGQDGSIFMINLRSPPRVLEHHMSDDEKKSCSFLGHTKPVTCLTVSMDGTTVVSGSDDANVKIWSISSRQCLRTLPHKGPVTNVAMILAPRGMLDPDSAKVARKPPVAILARNKEETAGIHAKFPILPRANLKNRLRMRPKTIVINLDEAGHAPSGGAENGTDGVWSEDETENQVEMSEREETTSQKTVKVASRARYQNSILRMLE